MLMYVSDEKADQGYLKLDQQKLDEFAEEARAESGVEIDTLLVQGKPFEEIVKASEKINPVLTIMGYRGVVKATSYNGQNPFFVIRKSPNPVITVKGKTHKDGCEKIVLPLDASKETREKVGKVIEYGKMFGSTVYVTPVMTGSKEDKEKLQTYGKQTTKFIREKGSKGRV